VGLGVSLRDIRFEDIRPHEGSRNTGFEELCCQLAGLEPQAKGSQFYRKGRGADAGVECYLRRTDGTERGWQAKYVFQWDSSLATQLDKSIRTALNKHPNLTEYVVCVPFDLPDARSDRGSSQLAKWQAWRWKWLQTAEEESRSLDIELWSAHAIGERLSRDDAAYSGRRFYWFDNEELSARWFRDQFQKSRAALGRRYVPESNVELPIRKDFLAFVRDPVILKEMDNWTSELLQLRHSAVNAVERASGTAIQPHSAEINSKVQALVDAIVTAAKGLDQALPITEWQEAARAAIDAVRPALRWTLTVEDSRPKHGGSSPSELARHELYKLSDLVGGIFERLDSQLWKLANLKQLLLIGEAGSGKSHLLADVCDHQIERGAPAVLVLGSMLNDSEPWRQILTQLDLPASLQVKHFLGAMDAAAEAAGMRALVSIDALNERNGIDIWPDRLAAFLEEVERFPRVVVCLSCRTTYLPYILPNDLDEAALPRLTHKGFGGTSGEAAKHYLDMRGIVRPGAPNLLPEFNNPLFLKTCCDYLEKQGAKELPRGLQGITAIFNFYLSAASETIHRRMKLDRRLGIVPRTVKALSEAFAKAGQGYLAFEDAHALFEEIHPSQGRVEANLLNQLESEGVLAVEPVRLADETIQEVVRFTFERFSDHEIALHLLDEHLDSSNPKKSFAAGTPLFQVAAGEDAHRRAGVVEAIAIQLPERAGVELPDMLPEESRQWIAHKAFEGSLLWREQSRFTARTMDLAFEILGSTKANYLIISIATEPKNAFNALHLHKKLSAMSMPERDQKWSTFVADSVYQSEGPIETLISWAFEQGMDAIGDDRAELAAITLTWFFSTSARVVRDRATKALAALVANRFPLAIKMLESFSGVDDLYVTERLLASIYGAVLQGTAPSGLEELAEALYSQIFEAGAPPANALLRDHAAGVIHYAKWRGKLSPSIDIGKVGPPNASPWPIEFVPDDLIETYEEDYSGGRYKDAIVSSAGLGGDFGRYILPRLIRAFCPVPIGTKLLRSSEICQLWLGEFKAAATDVQTEAFVALTDTTKGASGQYGYLPTPAKTARKEAEEAFKATISSEAWEDFCVRARDHLYHGIFLDDWQNRSVANFDARWASNWIIKRSHDLGWTSERFGEFDRALGLGADRYDHRVERVGKKYQWLALQELAARMADNQAFKGDIYAADDGEPRAYRGALDLGLRDIDPSLLVHSTHYDGWRQWPRSWWIPVELSLGPQTPAERLAWRESDDDIINDSSLIDVTDPKTGRKWLVLHSFGSWTQNAVVEGRKAQQRDTWFRLECFVVARKDAAKFETWLAGKTLIDRSRLPKLELHEHHYLGEYPWHPALADLVDWEEPDKWNKLPAPIRQTVGHYHWEKGGYDCSLDESVSLQIPAPWLTEAMGLHLIDGRKLAYADDVGTIRFFDPSASRPGHQAALVDRDAFLKVLEENELEAVWVIAGEKSVFGGRALHQGWGGNMIHTSIYRLKKNGEFKVSKHIERREPSNDQMKEFLKA
jgi:hypothetical protein